MSEDPCEDICDALVSWANALQAETPNPLGVAFQASKPEDPNAALELETTGLQVMFFPYSEEEEKAGRGGVVLETFTVTMLVVRQLTAEFPRRRLAGIVRTIRDELRGVRMAGYVYSTSETTTKFDPDRVHDENQFLSTVRLSYKGMS